MANYNLNMNGQFINDCLDPALAQDVATKSYVDKRAVAYTAEGQIQYAGPSPFLPTTLSVGASGDVLTLAGTPLVPTWAPPTGTGKNAFVSGTFVTSTVPPVPPQRISDGYLIMNTAGYPDEFSPCKMDTFVVSNSNDPSITFVSDGSGGFTYTGGGRIFLSLTIYFTAFYQLPGTNTNFNFAIVPTTFANILLRDVQGVVISALKNGTVVSRRAATAFQTQSILLDSLSVNFNLVQNDVISFHFQLNGYSNSQMYVPESGQVGFNCDGNSSITGMAWRNS